MGKINDLSQGNMGEVWAAIKKLQYSTSQNNMAVGRGGVTVYGGGGITIENGGLYVNGSATINGVLEAAGTINMTGTFTATGEVNLNGPTDIAGNTTVTGDFTVTGPTSLDGTTEITGDTTVTGTFDVDGPMTTTGTLDVEGVTTLKNDLNVTTGKIKAGGLTIDPAASGGSLVFAGGGGVQGTSGVTVVKGFGNAGLITDTNASLFSAGMSLDVTPGAVVINGGPLRIPGMTYQAGGANVRYDASTGQLHYTT
ncbi:hypothetical protein [Paenarthrobacter ureafaciens]|uniref:hypothetical protein n=1 Tax=Paenarthrobacter ureafaciens TaxID=37931 RepID=UPI001FB37C60|nr:hypothetical protein [Paenarthrobacter ureafaciens]UOD80359.1 hypothetical protein MQZ73_14720 [Paenarthrobacter ureafaciens]WNZ03012.1 hypothetical protein PVT25_15360 [Paenarthrobacter ureafaciens]